MRADEFLGMKKRTNFPEFRVGDTVRVHVKIKEGEKERTQAFEGLVIKSRRGGAGSSFTVRKVSYGIGVERVFPYESASIDQVEVIQKGRVRRARLFYLRKLRGRDAVVDEATTDTSAESVGGEKADSRTSVATSAETKREAASTL